MNYQHFYSERHLTVLICLQETYQLGVFERHYMYACAKLTKQNKQMY